MWPENQESVEIFFLLSTQWIVTMGGVVGLNYTSLEMIMRIKKIKNKAELFDHIRLMERAAIQEWNKKGK